jgi:SAM-dependent methyltransferase
MTHDRVKIRLLNPDIAEVQNFLTAVGIADAQGRIKPSRQDKFRQIEEFVRLLDIAVNDAEIAGALPASSAEKPWQLVDLGCGNAYLTLAAYTFLAQVRGEHVRVHGVDVREDSYVRNTELARSLGVDGHVTFEAAYISDAAQRNADVVLALHACDTATDDALAVAARNSASVLLASPCCHHDLQRQIGSRVPAPYDVVTGSGILRQRFIDVLTDGLRAQLMRMVGYRVDVVEYVSDEHTNRNLMIRAIRTGASPHRHEVESFDALVEQWQVRPRLAELLAPEITAARARIQ